MTVASIDSACLRAIPILTADSRRSRRWTSTEIEWPELVARLSEPRRLDVTYAAMRALPADERHALKDVGGYVGGRSSTGYRKAADVVGTTILRLDMDGAPDAWRKVVDETLSDLAYLAHTTASHRPGKARVRVVVPMSRAISHDEYAYVSRRIAERIGTSYWPDHSTFRSNQVAFWPCAASDAEFVAVEGHGRVLDVDALLSAVDDWTDTLAWPFPPRDPKREGQHADPTTKRGWVGAFCRQYDVHQAIAVFLSHVYERGASPDRYSSIGGSLRNGVVIYGEGRFAYSHHEISDPAAGQLCNAWDLVRVHLYGHTDKRSAAKGSSLPSYKAMIELAQSDAAVTRRIEVATSDDFDDETGDGWRAELSFDRSAVVRSTFGNLCLILRHDERFRGRYRRNELSHTVEVGDTDLNDVHVSALRVELESAWHRDWPPGTAHDAVALVALDAAYHPIVDLLDGLEWDGVARLDRWLVDYCGAPDTAYTRAVGRKTLVGAVSRARDAGCKFDHMLLLHGAQGAGKSTICRVLALEGRWFCELRTVDSKGAAEIVGGIWIAEMCELEGFDKHDVGTLKAFVTVQADRYRPAYGRLVEVRKRSCIVIGTTNEVEVLRDSTGNRRFWPVHVGKINTDGMRSVVRQLYAEADFLYGLGETTWLDGDELAEAQIEQEAHRIGDPWEDRIATWLAQPIADDWYDVADTFSDKTVARERVCVQEILDDCLGIAAERQHTGVRRRVGAIMRLLSDWSSPNDRPRTMRFGRYGRQKGWSKVPF